MGILLATLLALQAADTRGIDLSVPQPEGLMPAYGERHALVIGINAYADSAFPDLSFAVADAQGIANALIQEFEFAPENVHLLQNGDATKQRITEELEDWACNPHNVGENDLFTVFFAGHGITRDLGEQGLHGYLVPSDGRSDSKGDPVFSSLIGMNMLQDVSIALPAKHGLFLLDCCFAGLAVKRSVPPVAAGLTTRARQVLTAGTAGQAVLDRGGGDNSVFTGALLAAMKGEADLDADGVITFGELFNYVGREVERRTDKRQTPLQETFPDHDGGSVALFPPGVRPGDMSVTERLREIERTAEERLEHIKRLSDTIAVRDLLDEVDDLWPALPELVPEYRDWLADAEDYRSREEDRKAVLRRLKQEAFLRQVATGLKVEGEGGEPDWEQAEQDLRWEHDVTTRLVRRLKLLGLAEERIRERLTCADTLEQRSLVDHATAWEEVAAAVRLDSRFGGLALKPQLGLVPLGVDPESGLFEFADLLTGSAPERDEHGTLKIREESGLVFVLLPGGRFTLGISPGDTMHSAMEAPPHERSVSPYLISKYEMTQAQWMRLTTENPSGAKPPSTFADVEISLLHPVEQISWDDCATVLPRARLRLPTEVEWEIAARSGVPHAWWAGADPSFLQGVANLADQEAKAFLDFNRWKYVSWNDGYAGHSPVGWFAPNLFGLHDVFGNVWEWCTDSYPETSNAEGIQIARGGGFNNGPADARASTRVRWESSYSSGFIGVRPVCPIATE